MTIRSKNTTLQLDDTNPSYTIALDPNFIEVTLIYTNGTCETVRVAIDTLNATQQGKITSFATVAVGAAIAKLGLT